MEGDFIGLEDREPAAACGDRLDSSTKVMRPTPGPSDRAPTAVCVRGVSGAVFLLSVTVSCMTVCAPPALWSAASGTIFCRWLMTASMSPPPAISTSHSPGTTMPRPLPSSRSTRLPLSALPPWLLEAVFSTSVSTSGEPQSILNQLKVTLPTLSSPTLTELRRYPAAWLIRPCITVCERRNSSILRDCNPPNKTIVLSPLMVGWMSG
mmetsp:Transcript_11689/g.25518  ORF Transcript_11689/g.25518 Transcript_11689/m.25518 type:complete len:208 (+) Transcript_11689:388-1011(+)